VTEEFGAALAGIRAVTLAVNVPGPAAAARLHELGAAVVKVEPPSGDPLFHSNPAWYKALAAGQEVVALDLKDAGDRARLDEYLAEADLLLTSSRPGSLARLGLGPEKLRSVHPELCYVAITGYPAPRENEPGHDLTYLADYGLLSPPEMPKTLLADLAGAERAVSAALALLLGREHGRGGRYVEVPLSEAAATFAEPLRFGITAAGAPLGGGLPGYNLYEASDGWISVAALESHFWERLLGELGIKNAEKEDLAGIFAREPAAYWEEWAAERDLPITALRDAPKNTDQKEQRC
jgi:alpha-methylacyl-CoA racemase